MFFVFVGAHGGHNSGVCDFAPCWDGGGVDEKYCVCARGHALADALGETAKIVSKTGRPDGFVGATNEVPVFVDVAGHSVDDGIGGWWVRQKHVGSVLLGKVELIAL